MAKNKVEITGLNTSNIKVLNNEEMIELFNEYKQGDKSAKQKLIEGNLKLVLSILKRYQNRCDNMDDLFQMGCIGLIKAIDNFDLEYEVRFSTYAVLMIEGEIKRYIRDNNPIRISRGIKENAYNIITFKEKYFEKNGKYPTHEEICEELNINSYELNLALMSLKEPMSIFDPIYNDGGDTIYLLDQIEDKKSSNDLSDLIALRRALSKIKEREKKIIIKRYLVGKSQTEIAQELGISQAQVSRIETSAIKTLKRLIS